MAEVKKEISDEAPKTIDTSEKPIFSWEAEEFNHYEKSGSWTLSVIIFGLVVAGLFFWMKNWTGVGLAIAGMAAIISQGYAKPKKIRCAIFQGGVVINDKPHNFGELKSFWLIHTPSTILRFEQPSRFSMTISAPISDSVDSEQVRLFLKKRLPEHEDRGEDLSDRISRWIKL